MVCYGIFWSGQLSVLSLQFLVSALSEITVMQVIRLKEKENKNLRGREITEL